MSSDSMPVILVAAKDTENALRIISELIKDDVSKAEDYDTYVWVISTKYYTAQARLRALPDTGPAPTVYRVEAHVIHLAEDECTAEVLEQRAARARGVGGSAAEVQLVLADCAPDTEDQDPSELADLALRLNMELIPLRGAEPGPPADGPFPCLAGAARAREALEAHTWPGLELSTSRFQVVAEWDGERPGSAGGSRSGGSSTGRGSPEPGPEECIRRAELFADALQAMEGVRDAAGGAGTVERLVRAEQLLAAFCRALDTDIDSL